jgi:hypothetical protein
LLECRADRVEEGLATHGDVEGDVEVRLVTARVELDVPVVPTV